MRKLNKKLVSNFLDYLNYTILLFMLIISFKTGKDYPSGKLSYIYFAIITIYLLAAIFRKRIAQSFKKDVIDIILISQFIFTIILIFVIIEISKQLFHC
jgi:hypothetical protein